MIISAQMRHCKNCHSVDIFKVKDLEPTTAHINMKVVAKCNDCGHQAKYPQASYITIQLYSP